MEVLKKIASIFFAIAVLFSAMGISLHHHYCGDVLISTTAYLQPDSCCGDKDMSSDCCHNEQEVLQVKENAVQPLLQKLISPDAFTVPILFAYSKFTADTEKVLVNYLNYYPPLIESDIIVLVQSFLI